MTDKYFEEMQQRIAKLPERVRNYIAKLEKDVAYYRRLLTETEAGQTSVMWTDYGNKKHLPNEGLVRWQLPNGSRIEITLRGDNLEVRNPDGAFESTLVMMPAYSNVVYVTVLKSPEQIETDKARAVRE